MCLEEQILNALPLTPVSDDPNYLEALTPNLFQMGQSNIAILFFPSAERYTDLSKSFRTAQACSNLIWQRWRKESLAQNQTRNKWNKSEQ